MPSTLSLLADLFEVRAACPGAGQPIGVAWRGVARASVVAMLLLVPQDCHPMTRGAGVGPVVTVGSGGWVGYSTLAPVGKDRTGVGRRLEGSRAASDSSSRR